MKKTAESSSELFEKAAERFRCQIKPARTAIILFIERIVSHETINQGGNAEDQPSSL